jgi:uncharacterized membrane protein
MMGDRTTEDPDDRPADDADDLGGGDGAAADPVDDAPPGPPLHVGGAALHPLLVTVPLGAFVCTVAFDVASRASEGYVYARGAMWLSIIGIVSALVAGAVGAADARRTTGRPADRSLAVRHAVLNGLGLLAFVVSLLLRRNDLDALPAGTPTAPLVVAAVGLVLLVVSAVTGGTLAGRLDRPVS